MDPSARRTVIVSVCGNRGFSRLVLLLLLLLVTLFVLLRCAWAATISLG
jgi:hypothetical protein